MTSVFAQMPPPLRVLALVLALLGFGMAQQARAQELGIATGFDDLRWKSDRQLHAVMEAHAATGATWFRTDLNWSVRNHVAPVAAWFRTDLNWSVVQPTSPDRYDWSAPDRVIRAALAAGLKVLPVVSFAPRWTWKNGRYSSPQDSRTYAAFMAEAVRHYEPMGITAWEIWNEPNLSGFWPSPDPMAYARLLRLAYPAIKQVDPDATVIAGGLSPVPRTDWVPPVDHYSAVEFVKGIYKYGAGKSFDALGFHPYSYPHQPSENVAWSGWTIMTGPIRDLMVANGDAKKKIWLTEYGAPTHGSSTAMTEAEQAAMVTEAADLLKTYDWAGPLFWYGYSDRGTGDDNPEDWFGLVTVDGRAKPALEAFRSLAKR